MIIPPGYCAFFIRFNLVGDPQPMYTHIGYDLDSGGAIPTQSDVDAASTALHTAWLPELTSTYTMGPHHVLVGNDGDPTRVDGTVVSAAGSAGGGSLTQNVCILGRKRGALSGPSNQGRMYVPGVNEAFASDAGALTSAAITAWNANFAALGIAGSVGTAFAAGPVGLLGMVVFHDASAALPADILQITTDPVVATQRRRLRR